MHAPEIPAEPLGESTEMLVGMVAVYTTCSQTLKNIFGENASNLAVAV